MGYLGAFVSILVIGILVAAGYELGRMLLVESKSASPSYISGGNADIPSLVHASASNARWNHFPIRVYVYDNSVDGAMYVNDFKRALVIWQNTGLVSFSLVNSPENADITVMWVKTLSEKSLDTLGDTKLKFINLTQFGVIKGAEIELLSESSGRKLNSNDMTNLALHEIGHAIGLEHVNVDDIMNPVLVIPSKEIKQVSQNDINRLNELYSLPVKPDMRVSELSANKTSYSRLGRSYFYINVSASIENMGLKDADNVAIEIYADGKVVKRDVVDAIEVGSTLNIMYANLRADGNFTNVQLQIDPDNSISELDETNNYAQVAM